MQLMNSAGPHTSATITQRTAIVTDSVAQVPPDVLRQLQIAVVPLTIQIDGETYLDGIDMSPSELYRRMRHEGARPTTTAPSLGLFQESFRNCLDQGAEAVLCITISSQLSSTYSAACLAAAQVQAECPDRVIEVLDSREVAIVEGFVVMAAARAAAEGKTLAEVLETAREAGRRSGLVATVETLDYLARNGRIGKASYLLGSMINIKPLLTINDDGFVAPVGKVRGENRAMEAMVDHLVEQVQGYQKLKVAVIGADAQERAARLEGLLKAKLEPDEILHSEFTPVLGVHTGPGMVGLAYHYE
jgi:DegV family protein with EDD domain